MAIPSRKADINSARLIGARESVTTKEREHSGQAVHPPFCCLSSNTHRAVLLPKAQSANLYRPLWTSLKSSAHAHLILASWSDKEKVRIPNVIRNVLSAAKNRYFNSGSAIVFQKFQPKQISHKKNNLSFSQIILQRLITFLYNLRIIPQKLDIMRSITYNKK